MYQMEDGKIAVQERKNGVRGHSSSGRHGGAEHAESSSIRHHKVTEAFHIAVAQPGGEIGRDKDPGLERESCTMHHCCSG